MDVILCAGRGSRYIEENMLEKLEVEELEFKTVGEFLTEIKKKFGGGEEESVN